MANERQPSLLGVCHVWVRRVRLLGYRASPKVRIPLGSVGDLEVSETAPDGRVIQARFHGHGEGNGYWVVRWPEWEYVDAPLVEEADEAE